MKNASVAIRVLLLVTLTVILLISFFQLAETAYVLGFPGLVYIIKSVFPLQDEEPGEGFEKEMNKVDNLMLIVYMVMALADVIMYHMFNISLLFEKIAVLWE